MMALWMAYALVLSLLLATAARVAEEGLDLYEWPTRWVWIGAMAGGIGVPASAYATVSGWLAGGGAAAAAPAGAGAGGGGAASLPVLPAAGVSPEAAAGLADRLAFLDPWLLGGWAVASAIAAGWLLAGWIRLRARRRRWEGKEIDGVEVLISPDEGPAITGFFRGTILLPVWFEELDRDLRPLVLRHEREHLAVGDHRLLAAGLAAVVLFPWNPVLWWSLARLRQAMEIDCDRRVLGNGVDRAAYGELLVQVGERASGPPLSPAAFADSSSFLERRIRRLAVRSPGARIGRTSAAVVAAGALVGAAVGWVPSPDGPVDVAEGGPGDGAGSAAAASGIVGPPGERRQARVVPPAPAVMRLDLRLYRAEGKETGADGAEDAAELDMEAVRLAKRLSYACAPFLNGEVGGGAGGEGGAAGPGAARAGCFVVVDGEPTHPSVLGELGAGSIDSIRILPADEAVARYGAGAREGAYVIRTGRG